MSHAVDTMAYRLAGGLPWHGLGTPMPDNATLDEGMQLAEMTWEVEMHRAFVRNPLWKPGMPAAEKAIEVPNLKVALRNDTWGVLGYASDTYVPIQLRQLAAVWEPVLTDQDGVKRGQWETLISLYGGRRIVAVAKVPGDWHIAGEAHVPYLTATTSFDSSSNALFGLTITRTVCANTLGSALGEWKGNTQGISLRDTDADEINQDTRALRVRHRGNVGAKLEKVSGVFERAFQEFNGYKERAEKLAAIKFSLKDARMILEQVIEGESDRSNKMREDILALSVGGVGQKGTDKAGTAYGLLQGTTEYVDHHRMLDATAERRFSYITDGAGSRLKDRMQATLVRELLSVKEAQQQQDGALLDRMLG
jgi:phage/plasmid-like protein (TIGR03299 family)